jgi:acyl-CoA synthetase (AMP-forming)/AMP-acid ligase II
MSATIVDVLDRLASERPDWPAVVQEKRELSYRRLAEASSLAGAGLGRVGVQPGDVVGIWARREQWLAYAVAYFAVLRSGGVACPRQAPAPGFDPGLGDIDPTFHVSAAGHVPDSIDLGALLRDGLRPMKNSRPVLEDPAQVLYTSGSTGEPKPVLYKHADLLAPGATTLRPVARRLAALHHFSPFSYAGTQASFLGQLQRGVTSIALARVDPGALREATARHRPTLLLLTPSVAALAVNDIARGRENYSSVRLVWLSGAPSSPELLGRLSRALPAAEICTVYGLTEGRGATLHMRYDPTKPDALGYPRRGVEVAVLDDDDSFCRPRARGEIALRTTVAIDRSEGHWVRTGDLGTIDWDGCVRLAGRKKDMVIVAGQNVMAVPIEAVLQKHPAVTEATVLGLPHPLLGEQLVAVVLLRAPVSQRELVSFAARRLPAGQVPSRVLIMESLPRTTEGKVRKAELRKQIDTQAPP